MQVVAPAQDTPTRDIRPIELENASCPRCGGDKSAVVYRSKDHLFGVPGLYSASRCLECGLWFQNPRPQARRLIDLYPDSYPNQIDQRAYPPPAHPPRSRRFAAIRSMARRQAWIKTVKKGWDFGYLVHRLGYRHLEPDDSTGRMAGRLGAALALTARWLTTVDLIPKFVADGKLLEVGCGNGDFLLRMRELGWTDLSGVELSEKSAQGLKRAGLDVRSGTIEEAIDLYPDNHFDVIVSSMVLEHLLNPFETVRRLATKLKPGGEFLFSTVIRDSLDGHLFGPYSVSYDFPRHMVFFHKDDLRKMLAPEFEQVQCCHHSTPIDFWRPAQLRGRRADRLISAFFTSPVGHPVVKLLARLKLMGRVSFRCHRTRRAHSVGTGTC